MNKYLMLTAAALLASATTVDAKTYCFVFGDDRCDGGKVFTGVDDGALSGAVRAWVHTNNDCLGDTSEGYGFLSETSGLGKVSLMSDDYLAKNYGSFSTAISYVLPKNLTRVAPCAAWLGIDGTTFFEVGSGVIYPYDCQNAAKAQGRKSTLDGLRELIRAHHNALVETRTNGSAR
jgi:hypothetical protein